MAKITLYGRDGVVGQTLVDDNDYEWLSHFRWHLHPKGYAITGTSDREVTGRKGQYTVMMARIILGLRVGDKRQADHINGDKLDNRRVNLRIVDHGTQMRNRRKRANSLSIYKGVHGADNGRWSAYLSLGEFDTEEEAARIYDKAVRLLFPGMPTNFPQKGERCAVAVLCESGASET